jgi:hypothetical protein
MGTPRGERHGGVAPKAIHGEPVPEAPEIPKFRSRPKDTKRWCHGKVGLEHRIHWQPWGRWYGSGKDSTVHAWQEVCSACGKVFRWCNGSSFERGRLVVRLDRCVCPPGKGHRFALEGKE